MDYTKSLGDFEFGCGDIKVNVTDAAYADSDFSKFVSLGGTEKDSGATLSIGAKNVHSVFGENDLDEPKAEWVESQEITFSVTLLETSLYNIVLALGGTVSSIVDKTDVSPKYKYYRVYDTTLPNKYPFLFEVPQDASPTLKDILIMPRCEVLGAVELTYKDDDVRKVRLSLRLRKATAGALAGKKLEVRRQHA